MAVFGLCVVFLCLAAVDLGFSASHWTCLANPLALTPATGNKGRTVGSPRPQRRLCPYESAATRQGTRQQRKKSTPHPWRPGRGGSWARPGTARAAAAAARSTAPRATVARRSACAAAASRGGRRGRRSRGSRGRPAPARSARWLAGAVSAEREGLRLGGRGREVGLPHAGTEHWSGQRREGSGPLEQPLQPHPTPSLLHPSQTSPAPTCRPLQRV